MLTLRRYAALAIAALLLPSCGGDSPVKPFVPVATTVTLSTSTLSFSALAATQQLSASVLDQKAQAMPGAAVSWTSSDQGVATVSATGLVTAMKNGSASITAAVGTATATAQVTVLQLATQVAITPNPVTFSSLGATRQLNAALRDAGGASVSGGTVTWSSSNNAIASVSAAGLLTAVANGSANITATAGTATTSIPVTVAQAVATLALNQQARTLTQAGETFQLQATARDSGGTAVATPAVTWSSSAPEFAAVSGTGVVTAVATGAAIVTARSGNATATAAITVTLPGVTMTITSVEPSVLVEGATATIRGTGFAAAASGNQVTIDGLNAAIVNASTTELRVTVPAADCRPPRQVELRVQAGSASATQNPTVRPAQLLRLAVGEGVHGGACLHIDGGSTSERYLIGVLNTSETVSTLTPASLSAASGQRVQASSAFALGSTTSPRTISVPVTGNTASFAAVSGSQVPAVERNGELEIRRKEREFLERLDVRAVRQQWMSASMAAAAIPAVGDTLNMRVPTSCEVGTPVRAVVRHVGTGLIFLEDVGNPVVPAFTSEQLQAMDVFYAQNTLPTITSYFGSFMDIDTNQRVVVLMTKEVNKMQNVDGFVWAVDLVPASNCPGGNFAEIFYGVAPDPDKLHSTRAVTQTYVQDQYPSLIAHEVTHVLQSTQYIWGPAALKATWEMEGGATLAEQLVGYRVLGHGPGQNLGRAAYQAGSPGGWYSDWPVDLAVYFGFQSRDARIPNAPEQCSWMGRASQGNGGPCLGGREVYGVPAMFLRMLLDRYASSYPGGEAAMMRALTMSPDAGLANAARVTGQTPTALLARFGMALWADDRVGDWITSWNLPDIWGGFVQTAHLLPYNSDVTQPALDVSVRAGSNAYLTWTPPAAHSPTSLRIRTAAGAALPSHMVLWVLRVQ